MAQALLAVLPEAVRTKARQSPQPKWISPMLATLTQERFSREGWLFEPKWDGERCLVFGCDGDLAFFSRNKKRLNGRYPELAPAFDRCEISAFIADGEIVAFRDGITSFTELQKRMQVENPSPSLVRQVPVYFYLFDLLYLNGYDLRQVPLRYRKILLRDAFTFGHRLRFTAHRETEGEAYYREACRSGWEGIIAKNGNSQYVSKRTRDWLKFKCEQGQEFVVGGYTEPRGTRKGFGALLLGVYRKGRLHYAGKVGTGFDNALLESLAWRLRNIETHACPFADEDIPKRGVHWVKPELVAQIAFTEWTTDGRLRHPRFLGLRDDKRPSEVVREG
jgi:DNA ligase D-like protein (predicted ligase)